MTGFWWASRVDQIPPPCSTCCTGQPTFGPFLWGWPILIIPSEARLLAPTLLWVADLADSLNLPCYLGSGDVRRHQQEKKISLQTAARQLRLHFFDEIKQKHHYQTVALGHTADDQVELFFLRLLRGAGPEGMKGMWPFNPTGTIRPLLGTSKTQIVGWLESEGLSYRLDTSNLSRCYRRNQLRLDLLPQTHGL